MDNFEKVEKLREKANVSYEEAKEALEKCNWDMLDAMIYLEKSGKVFRAGQESYSTQRDKQAAMIEPRIAEDDGSDFTDALKRFGSWCLKWIKKGNTNYFKVTQRGKDVITIPITLLVVLLMFAFWVMIPLFIIGLFFNMRYSFVGPNIHAVDLNQAMDGAADTAENLKSEFTGSNK